MLRQRCLRMSDAGRRNMLREIRDSATNGYKLTRFQKLAVGIYLLVLICLLIGMWP